MVKLQKLTNLSIVFIGIYLLVLVLRDFSAVLRPLAIAFILSFLFIPSFDPKAKRNRWFFLIPIVMILVILGLLFVILNPLKQEVANLDEEHEIMGEGNISVALVNSTVASNESRFSSLSFIKPAQWNELYFKMIDYTFKFVSDVVTEFVIVILFLIFLISAFPRTINSFIKKNKDYLEAFIELEKTIKTYLLAKSFLSFLTAFFSFFVMWMFGVDFKFILALMIFLFNFIPNFGSIIAVCLILFVHFFAVGFSWNLIGLAVALVLVQLVIGNYIDPKYVGKKVNLSPLVVLFSLLFWGIVWGIPGMFFSVPLTSIVLIVAKYVSFK